MIDKISLNCITQKPLPIKTKAVTPVAYNSNENADFKSLYMPNGVSFRGNVFALSKTALGAEEEGVVYRSKLAQAVGTSVESLSIMIVFL